MTLDQMKQSPKKESWVQKKMKQAQDMAEMQQKGKLGGPNLNKYIKEPKRRDTKKKK